MVLSFQANPSPPQNMNHNLGEIKELGSPLSPETSES